MKRHNDTITIETRYELDDLLQDLEKIPESEQSAVTKQLIKQLTILSYEW